MLEILRQTPSKYEVFRVEELHDGLDQLQREKFEAILLDLFLPDSRGIATLKAVKPAAHSAAIIALLHSDEEALVQECLRAGAQDCLFMDSLNEEILGRSIRYAIEQNHQARQLEKHAREAAQRKALLRRVFDANIDAMLILTPQYEIRFFNAAAARLLEAERSTLVGEIFPFEVSTSQSSELEIPEANGESHLFELSAIDLVWEGESALLVSLRDITQKRVAEQALKQEQARISITLDLILDAVITTDASGRIEWMNQEASRLTGWSKQAVIGKPVRNVLRLRHLDSGKLVLDPLQELFQPEEKETLRQYSLLPEQAEDSSPRWVAVQTRCIPDEEGQSCGCIILLRDITRQKRDEEELFKSEKLQSINLLVSGIAHDFNNLLTAILGNISVVRLESGEVDKNSKKLQAAETAALQAKSLTQQLLCFSKNGAPNLEVTTVEQLVEESAQFILRGSNVKCEVEKEASLWPIDADKGQISQVINNLIINADQAMPSGGTITLRLRNCRVGAAEVTGLTAGDYLCIQVMDQGVGISPKHLKRIFDPYFTTKADGNGLGLASSQSIISSHHGVIAVESELGRGTCFSVYLPRSKRPELMQIEARPEPSSKETSTIHKGRGRILVMDDMEAMMTVAGEILNMLGYEVEYASNGEEAIAAYKKAKEAGHPFDACVFDLTVPGGMGGEKASEILIQYDPDLIAIASSGYTTSDVMSDYKNSAFKAVVPKPYRIKEMSDALHRVLG